MKRGDRKGGGVKFSKIARTGVTQQDERDSQCGRFRGCCSHSKIGVLLPAIGEESWKRGKKKSKTRPGEVDHTRKKHTLGRKNGACVGRIMPDNKSLGKTGKKEGNNLLSTVSLKAS